VRGILACLLAATSLAASAQTARAVWIDVPFVKQPRDGCGAASLSMVMQYWAHQQGMPAGPDAGVEAIQQQLYSPREHGIAASAMQSYLRRHGFVVFALNGRWSDLEEQLSRGRPLIVAIQPQGQSELHYVVVDGVDPVRGLVTMNDPAERKLLTQERAGFEKDWSATGHWMLLAVPASSSH
jgi:ABC-type bacteriocin/lantibiotic exporter with double-glycine peptidase domain